MERWYFCDHQTAFQSFPLHLTVVTNFLYPLQWHSVFINSIWIAFHQQKTPYHWPQTYSTHGKVVFWWPPDSFSVFPLHLTMATNFLCPMQWHRVSTDSTRIVFQSWKTLRSTDHKPLPHMERWYFCQHQKTAFSHSTALDCGYKLPVPTTEIPLFHAWKGFVVSGREFYMCGKLSRWSQWTLCAIVGSL